MCVQVRCVSLSGLLYHRVCTPWYPPVLNERPSCRLWACAFAWPVYSYSEEERQQQVIEAVEAKIEDLEKEKSGEDADEGAAAGSKVVEQVCMHLSACVRHVDCRLSETIHISSRGLPSSLRVQSCPKCAQLCSVGGGSDAAALAYRTPLLRARPEVLKNNSSSMRA